MIDPIDRWEPWDPHLELTDGPQRVYDDNPKPDLLLWEGDNT